MIEIGESCSEREFFNQKLKCGDLCREITICGLPVLSPRPCGAADWRVIRPNLFAPWERALQCNKCGLWTCVMVPGWMPLQIRVREMSTIRVHGASFEIPSY
jgi:hypothetical protein